MSAHDFNAKGQNQPLESAFRRLRTTDACRYVGVCSAHGLPAPTRIQRVRAAIWRRPPAAWLLLPRSVFLPGVCATYFSRELAGHRNVSARAGAEAVSRRVSWSDLAEHAGRRQPRSRLADLCRLCPSTDSPRSTVVRPRA